MMYSVKFISIRLATVCFGLLGIVTSTTIVVCLWRVLKLVTCIKAKGCLLPLLTNHFPIALSIWKSSPVYGEHCIWECACAFADCIHYKECLYNTNRVTHQVYKKGAFTHGNVFKKLRSPFYGVPETDYVLPTNACLPYDKHIWCLYQAMTIYKRSLSNMFEIEGPKLSNLAKNMFMSVFGN